MTRSHFFIVFFLSIYVMGARNAGLEVVECDLGKKIRLFDSLKDKPFDSSQGQLVKALVLDPLFAKDEEKYVEALNRLSEDIGSRSFVLEAISAFVDRDKNNQLVSVARERRASALASLLESKNKNLSKELIEKITRILNVDLADTLSAKRIPSQNLADEDWFRRIEVLSDRNENGMVISEITQREARLKLQGLYSCRLQFLHGKALRKSRRYQEAQNTLAGVAQKCEGDEGRDAAFLLARLAAISPSKENLKFFETFEKKYPTHSYIDDILLFKASAFESMNQKEKAKETLHEIAVSEFSGDMRLEAVFRLAFLYALEGNSKEAVRILSKDLERKDPVDAPIMQIHRAKYWKARLRLFPDLFTFKKAKSFKGDKDSKEILRGLANSTEQTFYSWLSAQLLKEFKEEGAKKLAVETLRRDLPENIESSSFGTIFCMFSQGYEDEAKRLIEVSDPSELNQVLRINIAFKLSELGIYSEAFRFGRGIIDDRLALRSNSELRRLLYPRAHAEEVKGAARQSGLPEELLYGLMREESRFDARAVSWAGARGVLQLMPSVAREEALKFKITNLSEEALFDPKINILLGAEHLRGMLEQLEHPLFAVAAYNAGIKSVKEWKEKFKRIKTLDAFVENIPFPETRNYVKRVANSWINYAELYSKNQAPFGVEVASHSISKQVR